MTEKIKKKRKEKGRGEDFGEERRRKMENKVTEDEGRGGERKKKN